MDRYMDAISTYAAGLQYADLTPEAVHAAKKSLVDAMGCGLAATSVLPAKIAKELASMVKSEMPASIIGSSIKTSPEMAAFANGTMVRYLDYNDGYIAKDGPHPSDVISGILAMCEARRSDGKTAVLGITLAYEMIQQLADLAEFCKRGWDNVTELTIGSALGSGKALGLNKAQMANALAVSIAANITLWQTRVGELTMWKGCAGPNAVRNGLWSALLAWKGMTGPGEAINGPRGLLNQVTGPFDLPAFGGKGKPFKVEGTYFKSRPVVYTGLLPIETAIALRKKIDLGKIASIKVSLDEFCFRESNHPEKWDPHTRETADHSVPYLIVAALVDGDINEKSFTPERFRDPQILSILKKLTMEEDSAFTKVFPKTFTCRIEVTGTSGQKWVKELTNPKGHPGNPMTDADIEKKFFELTNDVMPTNKAKALLELLWNIEKIKDISHIFSSIPMIKET